MWSLWIRTIARRGMDVSPGPYIKDQLSYPPDIVDDNEEHLDDTYVESLANARQGTENLVSEYPDYEDDGFYKDEKVLE